MPLFSDYYGSPFGGYGGYNGYNGYNSSPVLFRDPVTPRRYGPLLTTIVESGLTPSAPRRVPAYARPSPYVPPPKLYSSPLVTRTYQRPVRMDTDNIDVSGVRKINLRRAEPAEAALTKDGDTRGTIKRGRTVVRIHTKKQKDNPDIDKRRRMTPGERLKEKFMIRDYDAERKKKDEEEERRRTTEREEAERRYRRLMCVEVQQPVAPQVRTVTQDLLQPKQHEEEEEESSGSDTETEDLQENRKVRSVKKKKRRKNRQSSVKKKEEVAPVAPPRSKKPAEVEEPAKRAPKDRVKSVKAGGVSKRVAATKKSILLPPKEEVQISKEKNKGRTSEPLGDMMKSFSDFFLNFGKQKKQEPAAKPEPVDSKEPRGILNSDIIGKRKSVVCLEYRASVRVARVVDKENARPALVGSKSLDGEEIGNGDKAAKTEQQPVCQNNKANLAENKFAAAKKKQEADCFFLFDKESVEMVTGNAAGPAPDTEQTTQVSAPSSKDGKLSRIQSGDQIKSIDSPRKLKEKAPEIPKVEEKEAPSKNTLVSSPAAAKNIEAQTPKIKVTTPIKEVTKTVEVKKEKSPEAPKAVKCKEIPKLEPVRLKQEEKSLDIPKSKVTEPTEKISKAVEVPKVEDKAPEKAPRLDIKKKEEKLPEKVQEAEQKSPELFNEKPKDVITNAEKSFIAAKMEISPEKLNNKIAPESPKIVKKVAEQSPKKTSNNILAVAEKFQKPAETKPEKESEKIPTVSEKKEKSPEKVQEAPKGLEKVDEKIAEVTPLVFKKKEKSPEKVAPAESPKVKEKSPVKQKQPDIETKQVNSKPVVELELPQKKESLPVKPVEEKEKSPEKPQRSPKEPTSPKAAPTKIKVVPQEQKIVESLPKKESTPIKVPETAKPVPETPKSPTEKLAAKKETVPATSPAESAKSAVEKVPVDAPKKPERAQKVAEITKIPEPVTLKVAEVTKVQEPPKNFSPKSSLKMLQSMANKKVDDKADMSNILFAKDSVKQKPLILRSRPSTVKKQPKAKLALVKPPQVKAFPAPAKPLFMQDTFAKLQEAFNKQQQQQQQPERKQPVKLKKMRARTDLSAELLDSADEEQVKTKAELQKSQSSGGINRQDRHTVRNMKFRPDRVSTVRHQALKMSVKEPKQEGQESDSDSDDSDTETESTLSSGSDTETEEGQAKVDRNSTSSQDSGFGSNPNSPQASTNCAQSLDVRDASSPNPRRLSATLSSDSESGEEGLRRYTPPARTIPRFRKYAVEDYQFLKVLGKGSFGKVLLAELKGTECYYAVKCLKKDVVLEDDDVECTLIERKVLALGTKHPYLCHLFCTFQTESHLFFVMEYLNGGDLMFHIQQSGRFEQPRACFYAAEIVSGLRFLHKKGIVYRDLKLDNILLDFEGHVRIADFGMCKLQIYLDRTADTFCGTPDYMAPEIIKGLHYNQCVDWWSFGVLLFEMLVGQSPFNGCDEDDLFWSVCNEQPYYPRYLSKEAQAILVLLLEKDSSKRLGTPECPAGEVFEQPFFRSIDWQALERKELDPPFKPRVQHSLDVQYFDSAFTQEVPKLTPVDKDILNSMDQTQFHGFSYTNPNACNE
ncbi:serine/threonine-protein kinase N1-like [Neocloeon triangulifer]|uniref:serine/threonine-protein kinase N1-like n=1 Tax=Neocloeon triangulifer TaxID=2078957 RepID=UPI00286F7E8F|nr:serine/threonine-protein kinase N1-like [Neocloeon triangulifer]